MKNTRPTGLFLSVLVILWGCATFTSAYADDYSDVSQLLRAGKLPEALSKADQFLSTQPKDAQMRFLKGVIQRESGKASDAISTFTRLTEDYPELPEPYNNLAVLYAGQGQYDRARAALETALRTNPSYATAHENLGDVYAKLASQAYNKALQLDNSGAASMPKLAMIRELATTANAKGQRPAPQTPLTPPPMVAAVTPGKTLPTPPTLPALKPPATSSTAAPASQVAAISGNKAAQTAPTAQAATTPASALAPAPAPKASSVPPVAATAVASTAPPAVASGTQASSTAVTQGGQKEVELLVRAWAAAWSAKDVKTYLSLYGKEFDPPGAMSRASWEEERRLRITSKSTISVKLENLIVSVNGTKASAKFRQDYKANGLAVSSRKVLELSKTGDHWRIVKESVAN